MLMQRRDGTFDCGVYDVICVLHNVNTNTYHAAFFEESPMPGTEYFDQSFVRLKSKMHHTIGSNNLNEATEHLNDLASKIHTKDGNVWREPQQWDGDIGVIWMIDKSQFVHAHG